MAPRRRRPKGPGFGEGGGTNVADYIGLAERMQAAEHRTEAGERVVQVPTDEIDRSPYQARTSFDRGELKALARDIVEHGLNQPVTLRLKADGRYELIAGERRWLAVQLAGLDTVEARLRDLDDFAAHLVGVSENNQRANLSPWEKALEAQEVRRHARAADRPHAQRDLARYLNRNVAIVNQQLAIADAISPDLLARADVTTEDACRLPHETLHRIAKLRPAQRRTALREAVRKRRTSKVDRRRGGAQDRSQARSRDMADPWSRLWERGGFRVHIRKPLRTLAPAKAHQYLQDLLPGIGGLAARVAESAEQDHASAVLHYEHEQGRLLFLRPVNELTPERRRAAREALVRMIADLDAAEKSASSAQL